MARQRNKALEAWTAQNPLRRWRLDKGATLREVATHLGVVVTTVYYWETGSMRPTDASIERIADMMEVRPEELREAWDAWESRKPSIF